MTPSIRTPHHRARQFGVVAIEYALIAAFIAAAVLSFFSDSFPEILSSIWQTLFSGIA